MNIGSMRGVNTQINKLVNSGVLIFILGIAFDLCTTLIGLFLFDGLSEGNGKLHVIFAINLIVIIFAVIFRKRFSRYQKLFLLFVGLFRYCVGLLNVFTILFFGV